jgi:hypothetical protein
VPAREEEAEALREALSLGAWHQHRGSATTMTAIDRCSRAMRCLSGNAACQWPTGEAAGEETRRAAHSGLDGAPGHSEEQRKGVGLEW